MSTLTAVVAALLRVRDFVETQIGLHPRVAWIAGLVLIAGALVL